MTLKDLQECKGLADEMASIREQIAVMESRLYHAKPPKLDGMPKASGANDGMDMLVKYLDLKDRYSQRYALLADRIKAVEAAMEKLNPIERQAIRYRYLQGLSIYDVSIKLSYTERQIHRILREAESKICDS